MEKNKVINIYYEDIIWFIIWLPLMFMPAMLKKWEIFLELFPLNFFLILFTIKVCGYPVDIIFRIKHQINKDLIYSGEKLELKVNEIYSKPLKNKHNTIYYYYFYYKAVYKDPQTSKKYILRSLPYKTVKYPSKSSIPKIKTVTVFINKKNPKKYYMQIT